MTMKLYFWIAATCPSHCVYVSVCQVPVAEGKSVQQTVDILHKKLEQLGAVKQGSFCVDCETYHATGNVSGNNPASPYLASVLWSRKGTGKSIDALLPKQLFSQ